MKIHESTDKTSMSMLFTAIKTMHDSEVEAVAMYDSVLMDKTIPDAVRQIIEEIREDEKDHLVLLTHLLQDTIEDEMPDNGEEDLMPIEDEEDKE